MQFFLEAGLDFSKRPEWESLCTRLQDYARQYCQDPGLPGYAESGGLNRAAWCNDRHQKIDTEIAASKEADKTLSAEFDTFKGEVNLRMGRMETNVAKIIGGIGVSLVLIEVAAKVFAGAG